SHRSGRSRGWLAEIVDADPEQRGRRPAANSDGSARWPAVHWCWSLPREHLMFRNRWVRRLAVALPVTLVLAIGGWFYVRHKTQQQGLEQLNAVTSRLDATDPRWRLDDIDADRGFLPDDQN